MPRYDAKKDVLQKDIERALRQEPDLWVKDTSWIGRGIPDLMLHDYETYWMEVKSEKGRLTDDQDDFIRQYPGIVYVVRSIMETLAIVRGRRIAWQKGTG